MITRIPIDGIGQSIHFDTVTREFKLDPLVYEMAVAKLILKWTTDGPPSYANLRFLCTHDHLFGAMSEKKNKQIIAKKQNIVARKMQRTTE